jgi:streptogramin lyase
MPRLCLSLLSSTLGAVLMLRSVTDVNQNFISYPAVIGPVGVAANEASIYWGNFAFNTIGRANPDGSGANQSFLSASSPYGVAIDSEYLYWANFGGQRRNAIGRANLDGTGGNSFFITEVFQPTGVGVDGTHVYWANGGSGTIGRANLDGSDANLSFITGLNSLPIGIAVLVPEPSTGLLVIAGLLGLAGWRRTHA